MVLSRENVWTGQCAHVGAADKARKAEQRLTGGRETQIQAARDQTTSPGSELKAWRDWGEKKEKKRRRYTEKESVV